MVKDVIEVRGFDPSNTEVCVGLAHGQGFNKIGFIVKEKEPTNKDDRDKSLLFKNVFKDSGVKRLLIAAMFPVTPENHFNQSQLLKSLGMEGLEWGATPDLKMANILAGKSTGQPSYGCIFCDMPKPYTREFYDLTSLGDLSRLHHEFLANGSNLKKQSDFQNCVNPHLLVGDESDLVIDIINVPGLHLLLGVVDKHLHLLENVFGKEWMDEYLCKINIKRKSYQGSHALEGNQSNIFLEKLPLLEQEIMRSPDSLKIEGLPVLHSLRCFREVKVSCFGQELKKDIYENCIEKFSQVYMSIEGSVITPKIHIIQHHVRDFLKRKGEIHGLGWWSEQAFEAMHCDIKKDWDRVKILQPSHPNFSERLLSFVVRYNSMHL